MAENMRAVILTSSVLILALLILRRIFREKISRRIQYALWGLVLVRLLLPVSLPAMNFSVLAMAEPARASIAERLETPAVSVPGGQSRFQTQNPRPETEKTVIPANIPAERPDTAITKTKQLLTAAETLQFVWLAGVTAMALWLVISNFGFAAKLRRNRVCMEIPGCKRQVYLIKSGLPSPCLFGVLRPAIYLTPAAVASQAVLRHVLAHEETHARHLDPLWSLLRGVSLAVYWFNPLVWIAAFVSKTDCELACDEGAVILLGEEERLAYGRTLLSLIPTGRGTNPLLSATTMSSGKKRLRDRITRIAENRKTRKLALCAMAFLTAGACLLTFAGCEKQAVKKSKDGPLAAWELKYFNERFFNGDYMNINNQFLSSVYDSPADIDIFELVYCDIPREYYRDSGKPKADWDTVLHQVYGGYDPDCAAYSINIDSLDALLSDKTGLTLEETNRIGMDSFFACLPEYDTYYWAHGDTNYRGEVVISGGEREGELLHLYYDDTFLGGGWKRVTLRETEDGGYQFVSNTHTEKPVIQTAYPAGKPLLTVPLTDITPAAPQAVEITHHSNDCEERFTAGKNWNIWGHHIQAYRSTDGNIYVAEITEAAAGRDGMTVWEADCFAVMPDGDFSIHFYKDLFGGNGFFLSYYRNNEPYQSCYAFDEEGILYLLCTAPCFDGQITDMDGDGADELICIGSSGNDARLFFQREGRIYEADIAALLEDALAIDDGSGYFHIEPCARYISVCYTVQAGHWWAKFPADAARNIYFDGENLLIHKPDRTASDHLLPGVDAPPEVLSALRREVEPKGLDALAYNDWRVISLSGPWYEYFQEDNQTMTVEIYCYAYEYHAVMPGQTELAGGSYIDEDGWGCPGYPNCDFLFFRIEEDGDRTYLFRAMENDCSPGMERFREDLEAMLRQTENR